jgi:hypothetical protein
MRIELAAIVCVACLAVVPGCQKPQETASEPPAAASGLYAELVRNRDMEAGELPAWSFLAEGGAEGSMCLDVNSPLNEGSPHSLRMTVTKMGTRCGVANNGPRGMNIRAGQWYDASFYARTESGGGMGGRPRGVGLVFSLESADGGKVCARATIPEVGGPWQKYTLALHANDSDPHCRLVITPIEPTTMWLDGVSLLPRKTIANPSTNSGESLRLTLPPRSFITCPIVRPYEEKQSSSAICRGPDAARPRLDNDCLGATICGAGDGPERGSGFLAEAGQAADPGA